MIGYRDTTFCASPGCRDACGSQLTPEVVAAAERWWGAPGAPIALAHFCPDEAGDVTAEQTQGGQPA